jgi:hypothetical protein
MTPLCSRDTPYTAFAEPAVALRSGVVAPPEITLRRWFTPDELTGNGSAVRRARRGLETATIPNWAAALDAIATYDRSEGPRALTPPVALFSAGRDTVSTPDAMEELAPRVVDSRFDIRPARMHMSPFVDPRGLADLLRTVRNDATR